MSTNSLIAMEKEDGTIDAIYCHFDGYPEYNGELLKEYYTDPDEVETLIDEGSLSSLGVYISPPVTDEEPIHTFDNPMKDVCVFYHRDRGEKLEINYYMNIEEYESERGYQFKYLFKQDNNWYYIDKRDIWIKL